MRVLHIIGGLGLGGVETLLYDLCALWMRDKKNEHIIILFFDINYFDFDKLGIPCYICPLTEGPSLPWRIPNLLWRLLNLPRLMLNMRRKINTIQPDIIKAWMYRACFFTHLTASAKIPQIWGIHQVEPERYKKINFNLLLALLPRLPTDSKPHKIVFDSNVGMKHHLRQGYAAEKAMVIHNAVDTKKFYPSQKMRADKRKELGIEEDNFLIGNFSRFHKIKNHPLLANVFAEILKKHEQARFVLAGTEIDNQNTELMALFSDPIFQGKILFLGPRRDMDALFNALDCYVLASHSEGCPVVLLEAAACGVPAIANNVGDVSKSILDKKFLINNGQVQDFVDGIEQIMAWQNEDL
ncbi:MAG: glycosyltransferase, partial [Alphaproteobacteria bacterium]|nr:glycosyltransferase [Alphaproteobacteria bacterium]